MAAAVPYVIGALATFFASKLEHYAELAWDEVEKLSVKFAHDAFAAGYTNVNSLPPGYLHLQYAKYGNRWHRYDKPRNRY